MYDRDALAGHEINGYAFASARVQDPRDVYRAADVESAYESPYNYVYNFQHNVVCN
jgi:hypothetical protein